MRGTRERAKVTKYSRPDCQNIYLPLLLYLDKILFLYYIINHKKDFYVTKQTQKI